ncbi:MAG TPA: hypothetical protein VF945_07010 [Polyangia bacterium]
MLALVAGSTLALGCAHHEPHNLAQRQTVATPHSDFDGAPRSERSDRRTRPIEPPIVTPPIRN